MNSSSLPPRHARRATDEIYRILYGRIVSGDMAPGTRVDIEGIVTEFDVSRTPVREAVLQLEAVGLVERQPYRGSVVTGVDPGRLEEVAGLRSELEGLAAELGALRLTEDELSRMDTILTEIAASSTRPDYTLETFNKLNAEFHGILYSAADSPVLARLIQQLSIEADRMRVHFPAPQHTRHDDHADILQACRNRDARAAGEAMRRHIQNAYFEMTGTNMPTAGGVLDAVSRERHGLTPKVR